MRDGTCSVQRHLQKARRTRREAVDPGLVLLTALDENRHVGIVPGHGRQVRNLLQGGSELEIDAGTLKQIRCPMSRTDDCNRCRNCAVLGLQVHALVVVLDGGDSAVLSHLGF